MQGSVVQINVSPGGVPKYPIPRGVVTPLGLAGDGHNHPHIHGGPRKAILLIAREVVDELVEKGYPVFYGALGENLTTSGLDRRRWRAGQRYRIGSEVIIELTEVRRPCSTINVYGPDIKSEIWDKLMQEGNPASSYWGMSGFYASVIAGGQVLPEAPILPLDQLV